ncbi:MAG: RimK/LysX family protein [Pseudomonadota bacterium]
MNFDFLKAAMIATALSASAQAVADADSVRGEETATLGYIEDAFIGRLGLEMKAKLDTGADTSSLHARDMRVYKKTGKDNWVEFRVIGKNGRSIRYDQNVISFVRIKLKTGGTQRRPVIHLPLCVGGVSGLAEFTLTDRGNFDYEALIGREFLASRIVVDSGKTFAAAESCEPDEIE